MAFHVSFLKANNVLHSYQETLLVSHWPDLGHMPILEPITGQGDGITLRPIRFPFPELKGKIASSEQLVLQEGEMDA